MDFRRHLGTAITDHFSLLLSRKEDRLITAVPVRRHISEHTFYCHRRHRAVTEPTHTKTEGFYVYFGDAPFIYITIDEEHVHLWASYPNAIRFDKYEKYFDDGSELPETPWPIRLIGHSVEKLPKKFGQRQRALRDMQLRYDRTHGYYRENGAFLSIANVVSEYATKEPNSDNVRLVRFDRIPGWERTFDYLDPNMWDQIEFYLDFLINHVRSMFCGGRVVHLKRPASEYELVNPVALATAAYETVHCGIV
jgi:hypothetical protein